MITVYYNMEITWYELRVSIRVSNYGDRLRSSSKIGSYGKLFLSQICVERRPFLLEKFTGINDSIVNIKKYGKAISLLENDAKKFYSK